MHIRTFGLTHTGLNREKNEDRFMIKKMDGGSVFLAVADGMGGEVAGEYAAEITLERLGKMKSAVKDIEKQLVLLVGEADSAILGEVEKNPVLEGMGTTLTGIFLKNGIGYWAQVGDSRLYLLRDNKVIWQTKDQSLVQFLIDEGEITHAEANAHPARHMIDQCVGCGVCEPETGSLDLQEQDQVLLSTDGLHGSLDEATIIKILSSKAEIEVKANDLVNAALKTGGRDNITVVIAEI